MEQGQIGKRGAACGVSDGPSQFPGRLLEPRGNPKPRRMIATPARAYRIRLTVCLPQNVRTVQCLLLTRRRLIDGSLRSDWWRRFHWIAHYRESSSPAEHGE